MDDQERLPVQARAALGLNGLSRARKKEDVLGDLIDTLLSDEPLERHLRIALADALQRGQGDANGGNVGKGLRLTLGEDDGYWYLRSRIGTIRRNLLAWRDIERRRGLPNCPKRRSQAEAIRAFRAANPNWTGDPKNRKREWEEFKVFAPRAVCGLSGKEARQYDFDEILADDHLFEFAAQVYAKRAAAKKVAKAKRSKTVE